MEWRMLVCSISVWLSNGFSVILELLVVIPTVSRSGVALPVAVVYRCSLQLEVLLIRRLFQQLLLSILGQCNQRWQHFPSLIHA